jgi:hypothetical protein
MDRVLVIDQLGKLSYIDPPNEYIVSLDDSNRKFNRVSSSDWSIWSITSDFEICVYIYQRNFPIQVLVSTYENQVFISISFLKK